MADALQFTITTQALALMRHSNYSRPLGVPPSDGGLDKMAEAFEERMAEFRSRLAEGNSTTEAEADA